MRPAETPATVVLTLSRVLDGERPSWASVEAWEGLRVALGRLLDDARADFAAADAVAPAERKRALAVCADLAREHIPLREVLVALVANDRA